MRKVNVIIALEILDDMPMAKLAYCIHDRMAHIVDSNIGIEDVLSTKCEECEECEINESEE